MSQSNPAGVTDSEDPSTGLGVATPAHVPYVLGWTGEQRRADEDERGYAAMIANLRSFLDHVAAARPDAATVAALSRDLAIWRDELATAAVVEADQLFGRRPDLPGRGQTLSPPLVVRRADRESVQATVTFGRYHLGGHGAVHGGAVALLFDEILGRLANSGGRSRSRTARLHTDFRSITPLGVELDVRAWVVSEEDRKTVVRAEIGYCATLCAEAEALFVALRPGQA